MPKIRSWRLLPLLAVFGQFTIACGGMDQAPDLTGPGANVFAQSVNISSPDAGAGEVVSPASVTVRVQDANGAAFTLVAVDATFRSASGSVLAHGKWTQGAVVPAHGTGEAALQLSWKPQGAAARYLDVGVTTRDSAGVSHVLDQTVDVPHTGQ